MSGVEVSAVLRVLEREHESAVLEWHDFCFDVLARDPVRRGRMVLKLTQTITERGRNQPGEEWD